MIYLEILAGWCLAAIVVAFFITRIIRLKKGLPLEERRKKDRDDAAA